MLFGQPAKVRTTAISVSLNCVIVELNFIWTATQLFLYLNQIHNLFIFSTRQTL